MKKLCLAAVLLIFVAHATFAQKVAKKAKPKKAAPIASWQEANHWLALFIDSCRGAEYRFPVSYKLIADELLGGTSVVPVRVVNGHGDCSRLYGSGYLCDYVLCLACTHPQHFTIEKVETARTGNHVDTIIIYEQTKLAAGN